jgi:hypothetical protein
VVRVTDTVYEYSLNALSAALTQQSPVNMSALVTMCEDDYMPFGRLSEVTAEGWLIGAREVYACCDGGCRGRG